MKKISTILATAMVAGFGFSAQAQTEQDLGIFISGNFNNYAPEDDAQWQLFPDEDTYLEELEGYYLYKGYIYLEAADELTFNFQYAFGTLVPGIYEDGDVTASDVNVDMLTDDTVETGYFSSTGSSMVSWVISNWPGGTLEIGLDFLENMIILDSGAPASDYYYIRGEFNGYNPEGLDKWALMDDDEGENGVYTGTFEVPYGEFSFNVMNAMGRVFIPAEIENVNIEFTDGKYTGTMDQAYTDEEYYYSWNYPTWEGGQITVTVDSNEGTIEIYAIPSNPVGSPDDYVINGPDNDIITITWNNFFISPASRGAYITNAYGVDYPLAREGESLEYQITLTEWEEIPGVITVDLSSMQLNNGDYTLVIPQDYVEVISEDYEVWESCPEITYNFTINDGPTAVDRLTIENSDVEIYNLQGVRVSPEKVNKGIYIVNGKKVVL